MLGVEGVVVGPSATTTTTVTFPVSTTLTMSIASTAPAVVAGSGMAPGLLPIVTVASATGENSLLVPVPTLQGSNPSGVGGTGSTNTITTPTSTAISNVFTTNNNNVINNLSGNHNSNSNAAASMEQAEELVRPTFKDGEVLLEVECGQNKANMYLSKLCQGSKGPCISFKGNLLTPNEFQYVSGRETAKDWKRSIRHHGKSLKMLLNKGIIHVHPTMCDCEGCRVGAVLTRKGEKRRIPNGERKRKSTGNAPENSGNGAFRAVGNVSGAVKNQDGPSEPKRPALDKPTEGGQSPLKESSLMNVPAEVKDGGGAARHVDTHVQDVVGKMAVDSRLLPSPATTTPTLPLVSPDRVSESSVRSLPAVPSKEHKDHFKESNNPSHGQVGTSGGVTGPTSPSSSSSSSSDVKVLSSSGGGSNMDNKSLYRLAHYQAVSASVKGIGAAGGIQREDPSLSGATIPCDQTTPIPIPNPVSSANKEGGSPSKHGQNSDNTKVQSPHKPQQVNEAALPELAKENAERATEHKVALENDKKKDTHTEDTSQSVVKHSLMTDAKLCEPNNNNNSSNISISSTISISVSTPVSSGPAVAAVTSPVIAAAAPPASNLMPSVRTATEAKDCSLHKESKPKHAESSSSSVSTSSHSKHSEKEEHITIRHPSPERQPRESVPSSKPAHNEKPRDRKHESTNCTKSLSSECKERHSAKEGKDMSSRHNHERDSDRRRGEERGSDKDRKSGTSSGQSSKTDDVGSRGPDFPVGGSSGRVEGIPTSTPMVASIPVPAPVADPAAFSEYMRVLAAGHNGFVPSSVGYIPSMFPIRPSADVSLNSAAMMHPVQAAACGMFSTPAALLPKESVVYPATPGTLPPASYGYAAPGMPPIPILPQQYSTAASAASMLDYSRHFPYLHWSSGLPLMMPDAMNAAAMAAAAAGSSAKRSREEMESAMDISGKRLPLPVSAYGMGSIAPMDYMAAYRGLTTAPLSCGLESSIYDKNAELLRKRLYPDLVTNVPSGSKRIEYPYVASVPPEQYQAFYCCRCMENQPGDIRTWSVEEVVKLLSSLDGCGVYSEIFREQRVDGKILVLLTRDHLMQNLGMKELPAVTLINRVAKLLLDSTRSSGCGMCQRLASMVPAVQSAVRAGYS